MTLAQRESRRRATREAMRRTRARQRALDPTRNWRADEYELTKFKRATQESTP